MPEAPISRCEHALRVARTIFASGGYCRHRARDGEHALDVSQTRPTAIGTPQRMPEVPVSGREHELGLACNPSASDGYYHHGAGDGDHAQDGYHTRLTAVRSHPHGSAVPTSIRSW